MTISATPDAHAEPENVNDGRRWAPIALFIALSFGGSWLAFSPLLIKGFQRSAGDGSMDGLTELCVAVAMMTPALAAVAVIMIFRCRSGQVRERGQLRRALGLTFPRPWRRGVADCLLAIAVPAGLTLAAIVVGSLAGIYELDVPEFSGLQQMVGGGSSPVALQLLSWASVTAFSMLIWLPMFFGEELGWQGFLFPRLLSRGIAVASVGASTVFALWHLPTLLMGGQYPGHPWFVALPAMLLTCGLGFPIFAWLRLRSGSVLPAVLAHTFVSSTSVQLVHVLAPADVVLDPLETGLFGWPGWLVMGAFVGWLIVTKRLRAPEPDTYQRRYLDQTA